MSARCIFSFVVHLVMDLWYTCDALVDFDGLVDLFGWTWALIIIYCDGCDMGGWMCGWMRYICDGWDIYVIYVCMNVFVTMKCKKIKICYFGSLCRVLHSAKDPVAECHGHSTRQSWKIGARKTIFPALPSAMTMALGKELKKIRHSANIFF